MILLAAAVARAADDPIPRESKNLSLRNEIQIAIDKGLSFLKTQQQEDGSFSATEPNHPALTAMPLIAFQREPSGRYFNEQPAFMKKGYAFIRGNAKPDGGIYSRGLANYNTSVSLVALLNTGDPKDDPLIKTAHDFIVGQQAMTLPRPDLNGGVSYGPNSTSRQHPDLDNTLVALEALRAYRAARPSAEVAAGKDLNWAAAIDFVTRCQNLPSHNKEAWASDDPANKGGFIYFPGDSKAGEMDLPNGKQALRSYGTMSYAGLLSFIYADLKKDDPRVIAAVDWLKQNYTVDENPGLQRQGLYYYLHLMTKGLSAAGIDEFQLADGRKVNWRNDVALKIISLQNKDGSWANDNNRFLEKDPVLVTSYSVMALEIIFHQL